MYTLQMQVSVLQPPETVELAVRLDAIDEADLRQVLAYYFTGREDNRIQEPDELRHLAQRPGFRLAYTGLFGDDGTAVVLETDNPLLKRILQTS